ncbi:MAG: glycosyltransferase [candidate division Zixibacteria bacterium]|nr:glycosyltransferase [candidate division Zixibacteria bacterium]
MDDKLPLISVIMAVQNEERFIGQTLNHIYEQDYPKDKLEVIVIDGYSNDKTVEIAESFKDKLPDLKILQNPIRLAGSSRNMGFKEARAEYCVVIDGHVYIENKNLLRDMVAIFHTSGVDVLSRPQPLTPPDNSYFQNAVAYARESLIGHGTDSTIYNMEYEGEVDPSSSGSMYSKTVFEEVGYVDERFDAAEDYEFNYRISQKGYNSYISPKLAVFYYPRETLGGLFRQMIRYGLGRFRFVRKHSSQIISGNLIPPLFYTLLLLTAILAIFVKDFWILPAALLALYLGGIILGSIVTSFKRGLKYLPLFPTIYVTIHFGLAWGFISGIFRAKPGK